MYCSFGNTVGAFAVSDVGRPMLGFMSFSVCAAHLQASRSCWHQVGQAVRVLWQYA